MIFSETEKSTFARQWESSVFLQIAVMSGCLEDSCFHIQSVVISRVVWPLENSTVYLWEDEILKKQIIPCCCCLVVLVVKNLPASVGDIRDVDSIPGLGRSPVEGNSNPLQYSYLENPKDRKAWRATVHRVAKSQPQPKQLRGHTCCCSIPQSCLNLCDPTACSMPAIPVLYYLLEFAQIHVHWGSDAI